MTTGFGPSGVRVLMVISLVSALTAETTPTTPRACHSARSVSRFFSMSALVLTMRMRPVTVLRSSESVPRSCRRSRCPA